MKRQLQPDFTNNFFTRGWNITKNMNITKRIKILEFRFRIDDFIIADLLIKELYLHENTSNDG